MDLTQFYKALDYLDREQKRIRKDVFDNAAKRTVGEVITDFVQLRELKDVVKSVNSALNHTVEMLSEELIPDRMEAEGLGKSATISGVGRVTVSTKIIASIIDKDDKLPAHNWLKNHGHGGIIIETAPWQSLSAVAKDLLTESPELQMPKELFSVKANTYTSITKLPGEKK
jgi:hypothetical protein